MPENMRLLDKTLIIINHIITGSMGFMFKLDLLITCPPPTHTHTHTHTHKAHRGNAVAQVNSTHAVKP